MHTAEKFYSPSPLDSGGITGHGDVVADIEGRSFVAECKGGVINTRHAGQLSRLRQGLCETIGLSLASPIAEGRRQFAVVPRTKATEVLARRMAERAAAAGIEIVLIDGQGVVHDIESLPVVHPSVNS